MAPHAATSLRGRRAEPRPVAAAPGSPTSHCYLQGERRQGRSPTPPWAAGCPTAPPAAGGWRGPERVPRASAAPAVSHPVWSPSQQPPPRPRLSCHTSLRPPPLVSRRGRVALSCPAAQSSTPPAACLVLETPGVALTPSSPPRPAFLPRPPASGGGVQMARGSLSRFEASSRCSEPRGTPASPSSPASVVVAAAGAAGCVSCPAASGAAAV